MKWQKNYKMMWTALALSASLIATACSKGGGGGGTATTPVGQFGACGGCTFSQGVMMTATTGAASGMAFTIRLIGDSNQMAAQATSSSGYYNGPVMLDGTLVVSAQKTATNCVIPAGTYTLSTVQPGQMMGRDFTMPQFQAVGPTSLLLRFSSPTFVTGTYYGGVGRIFAHMEVLQGPMGYGTTYPTYPNPTTPSIGAIGACNDYWGFDLYN